MDNPAVWTTGEYPDYITITVTVDDGKIHG